jgi:hypothetical protein
MVGFYGSDPMSGGVCSDLSQKIQFFAEAFDFQRQIQDDLDAGEIDAVSPSEKFNAANSLDGFICEQRRLVGKQI